MDIRNLGPKKCQRAEFILFGDKIEEELQNALHKFRRHEVVASKVGKFLERLTPDSIDHATVEDQVIKKLIENLAAEGIKGEIAAINGLDLEGEDLTVHKELKVRKHSSF